MHKCESTILPLQQHPFFRAALRACGKKPILLADKTPLTVVHRRLWPGLNIAMVLRGQLNPDRLRQQLLDANLLQSLLILSPDHPAPDLAQLGAVGLVSPSIVAEIDLSVDKSARRAALHQKWRNRLVHAETNTALHVRHQALPLDAGHWVLQAEQAQQLRRRYRNWPVALTLAYGRENPGQARLFTAYEGRDPVAAMLFLRHGCGATYHIGHTTSRGRHISAHNLVLWRGANWLAAKGHRRLDLGLVNTWNAAGLARFKLGAGAKPRALGGTWGWWPALGRMLQPLARLDHELMHAPEHWTDWQRRVI